MSAGVQIGALCALAAALAALAIWFCLRLRSTPEKREQRRRIAVNTTGRLGDALVTEVSEDTLFYNYSLHGVQYAASQDISALRDRLPAGLERLIGPARMKYSPRNPANSILICEDWSGLRAPSLHANTVGHQPQDAPLAQGSQG
jgi:hypothetical protein